MNKIEAAIKASEAGHVGEIRFAVEGGLDGTPLFKGQSARARAIELFSQLRVWDTQQNTGVLIYLLFGGLSALGAALFSIGIPKDSVIAYEEAVKTDGFLIVAHGSANDMARSKAILEASNRAG